MSEKGHSRRVSEGEVIFGKVGLLIFLGIFLLGLGAELELWTAAYRAFFVWLVFSLLGGALRVLWKYHLYRQRESDLQANLDRARQEEERLFRERRERRERMNEFADMLGERLDGEGSTATRDALQAALEGAARDEGSRS
jgi:hypothetical protein